MDVDDGGISPEIAREIMVIRASGLFDTEFYARQRPDLPETADLVVDFCLHGWRQGLRPNLYFDPAFYLDQNPDIARIGINPLFHYIAFGDREGRNPSPLFHAAWYREAYGVPEKANALADYLARRLHGRASPVPLFDPDWYLQNNADVAAAGGDPFEHFLLFGAAELRDPCPGFDTAFYAARYAEEIAGQNPLLHYLAHMDGRFHARRPIRERLIAGAVREATRPSPAFETRQPLPPNAPRLATLLAYYLPQFHPIPENDAWWGTGFTDWTNLARATPRFAGHYQPRVPRDLGYYSLEDGSVLPRQIRMAQEAGIDGFVFYYYWFNRHRLLENPLERFLADPSLDMRFCLMWANENWTRRWDGLEREVLLAQDYRPEDDIALIDDFARHFADPRYIRLNGRPLLMMYRAALIPDTNATIERWRALFAERHGETPLIFMAQSFHDYDPRRHGLDGAIEFPPHKLVVDAPKLNDRLDRFDPEFSADVYQYEDIIAISVNAPDPAYPLIRTAVPGWDNEPRREGAGVVLHGATPSAYQAWLATLIDKARQTPIHGEAIVCINAWNEWAEGAYLEPDLHFGAAFLNATGRAATGLTAAMDAQNVLLVGHDALPHGAQMLLLHLARTLRRNHGIVPRILLLGGGELVPAYQAEAIVDIALNDASLDAHLGRYRSHGIACAIVNSAASARVCRPLVEQGIHTTLLIHEMPRLLQEKALRGATRQAMRAADAVVFSSSHVRDALCSALEITPRATHLLPQGNYQDVNFSNDAREAFRARLRMPDEAFVVLGVGFGDLRKGFDLFLQIFRLMASARTDIHFVWLGETHLWIQDYLAGEMAAAAATARFHVLPFSDDVAPAYAGADLYALTSREDPLPTTVIEALASGLPCVAFEGSGGIPDLLRETGTGTSVPLGDVVGFANAIATRLDHRRLVADRPHIASIARSRFDFSTYTCNLLNVAHPGLISISCAIISFNYRTYMEQRVAAIFGQAYPLLEVVLLDDASTDDSVAEARRVADTWRRDITIRRNRRNSGSPFAQWKRAADTARGEFVWIAEADDAADPRFLARLVEALAAAPDAAMAMAGSRAIDGAGHTVMPSYQGYYVESGASELGDNFVMDGRTFATKFLAVRNLILNVSGVLFRRSALRDTLRRLGDDLHAWKLAGDWRVYIDLLAHASGPVVWVAEPLNIHRRHESGVTSTLDARKHLDEIERMHAIAAEMLDLDAETLAAQDVYRTDLARQFGIDQATAPAAAGKKARPRRPSNKPHVRKRGKA